MPLKWRNPLEKYLSIISRYHYYVFFLVFMSKIPMFMHILNLIFLSPPMDYTCTGIDGRDAKNYCPCESPTWNKTIFQETMQTKFDLQCKRAWLIQFAHSMAYAGALIGCFVFGFLSDKFGRLTVYSGSCLNIAVAGCLITVMPSAPAFIFMRFIEGIGVGGCIVTSYVLCVEYVGVQHREILTALFHIPINISHILIPGVSYLIRDMDEFQLAISVPMFLFAALKWLVMESPKWLMDNGHVDEVAHGLQRMTTYTEEEIKAEIEAYLKSNNVNDKVDKVYFLQIFKHRRVLSNFCCMGVIYFVCGIGYYGVSQFIGAMAGNIHLNVAISGLVLLPGTILCIFLLKAYSRRNFLMITNFLSGIFMLALVCIPKHHIWVRVPFACFSNCFFFMSFIIAFLYGVELFPTSVRNSVLGLLSVLARIGQILVPPINSLSEVPAGCIFGVMAIIGGILCFPLPETKNFELPSSLTETKLLSRRKSFKKDSFEKSSNAGPSKSPD